MGAAREILAHLYGPSFSADKAVFAFMIHYSAFLDAAGKIDEGNDGWCVVAGFAANISRWEDFEADWNALLARYQIPYLQMSALHARKAPFDDPRWDNADYMVEFLSNAGRIVRSTIQHWGAEVINFGAYKEVVDEHPAFGKMHNPYSFCSTALMYRLHLECMKGAFPDRVYMQVFLEEGDEGIGKIQAAVAHSQMEQPIQRSGKPSPLRPNLRHYVHFQAADWLAFETRKLAFKSEIRIRASHRALLSRIPGQAKKWTADDLRRFCNKRFQGDESMTERENFDAAMKKILSVSKPELQRRIDAEKATKQASSRVPSDKD